MGWLPGHLGRKGRYPKRRRPMKTLNAAVMVIAIRLAVGYLYAHLLLEKLAVTFHQLADVLNGW